MKKKAHMCEPVFEAPQQKRSRIPWLSFGLMVLWAATFGLTIPANPGLMGQLADQWRSTVAHTAQALPRFSRGG